MQPIPITRVIGPMTESFFALITDYGVWIILASTYLSCLLVPIPSSMMMLAGGALVSVGDLVLWQVVLAAYAGAVLGDQSGFAIGQRSSKLLAQFTSDKPKRKALFTKAQKVVDTSGGIGVFFSTWLFAPLGPWVNIAAGAASMRCCGSPCGMRPENWSGSAFTSGSATALPPASRALQRSQATRSALSRLP